MVGEYYGTLVYFKNVGTKKEPLYAKGVDDPFGLSNSTYYLRTPTFADLDDDGDQDVLTGFSYGSFLYYENTGTPSDPKFAEALATPFGLDSTNYYAMPTFVDLDDDGDMDIFTPPAFSKILHKGIEGSQYVSFPTGGHVHHWEDLERFNRVTTEFLLKN